MSSRLAALVPCHDDEQVGDVVGRALAHVDEVLVVGDASPTPTRCVLDALESERVHVVHRPPPGGKGAALAFGVATLLRRDPAPDLVMFLDADGQHPPECIPAFVQAASKADIVIGNRRGQRAEMPVIRRLANDASSALLSLLTRRRLPDAQCGMRLMTAQALIAVPLAAGGFEAETRHLTAAARQGLKISSVAIPAVYGDAESGFRPLDDGIRVLVTILTARRRDPALKA